MPKCAITKLSAICAIAFAVSFVAGTARAIPSFGAKMPKQWSSHHGARTDFIFDREVKDYKTARARTYHYTLSIGLTDWLSFDGMVGLGDVTGEYRNSNELKFPAHFSWGYGWRARLYKNEEYNLDWVFGFQHMSTHPQKRHALRKKYSIIWDEWQLSTVIAKDIWKLTPYCGMKYSFVYLIDTVDGDRHRRHSNGSPIGLIIGTDMRMTDNIFVNVEGRFVDEKGLNAGLTYRY